MKVDLSNALMSLFMKIRGVCNSVWIGFYLKDDKINFLNTRNKSNYLSYTLVEKFSTDSRVKEKQFKAARQKK